MTTVPPPTATGAPARLISGGVAGYPAGNATSLTTPAVADVPAEITGAVALGAEAAEVELDGREAHA